MKLTHSQREMIWWVNYAGLLGDSPLTQEKLMHYTQLCGADGRFKQREELAARG